jgi:hypothetical protein
MTPEMQTTIARRIGQTDYSQFYRLPAAWISALDKNLPQQLIHTEKRASRHPTFVFNKTLGDGKIKI